MPAVIRFCFFCLFILPAGVLYAQAQPKNSLQASLQASYMRDLKTVNIIGPELMYTRNLKNNWNLGVGANTLFGQTGGTKELYPGRIMSRVILGIDITAGLRSGKMQYSFGPALRYRRDETAFMMLDIMDMAPPILRKFEAGLAARTTFHFAENARRTHTLFLGARWFNKQPAQIVAGLGIGWKY